MSDVEYAILGGRPYPMGATLTDGGVNFAVCSERAERVELCLFDGNHETRLTLPSRFGSVFCGFVPGIGAGQRYGFRVYGENTHGACFNPQKLLADPYARKIDGKPRYRDAAEIAWFRPEDGRDNASVAPKCVVVGCSRFDWEDDRRPRISKGKTVLYEAHVKGLTKQFPDLEYAGTYRALCDARVIAYLKDLGVTTVELLPVHLHLDEYHLQQTGLRNYWGYNTYSHFAVETDYAADARNADDELKQAVKTLHRAGLEVVLDVVYNHTAEQDETGAMLCQRGIDNALWYWQKHDGTYENWSGCGNTLKAAHRDVARWIADSLRYWAQDFHIDGFRFDLGTVLGREPDFRADAHLFRIIYQDPVLADLKLIAEAWDVGADGYRLGGFPQPFAEWNGRFRDDMRAFWVWENGNLGVFAERFAGSSDLFAHANRQPSDGINFITAHDGFTLRDLVSYNEKHNHANGENNRDGHNDNVSYNHGIEGETDNAEILENREYTAKALLASLFLANGTPMLTAGDEFGNSQQGNNNGYCQDNPTTWLDWENADQALSDYTRQLIALRREIALIGEDIWWNDKRVAWLNTDGMPMKQENWHDRSSKAMQMVLDGKWLVLINGARSRRLFNLPQGRWKISCVPSQKFNYNMPANCLTVEHMGIWILQNED